MSKFWFRKRKGIKSSDIGWGFIPVSWEGIASYIILLVAVIAAGFLFDLLHADTIKGLAFLGTIIVLMVIFTLIAKAKTGSE